MKLGETVIIPLEVAACPECGDTLYVTCRGLIENAPMAEALDIDCPGDSERDGIEHAYRQDEWRETVMRIRKHVGAVSDIWP